MLSICLGETYMVTKYTAQQFPSAYFDLDLKYRDSISVLQ